MRKGQKSDYAVYADRTAARSPLVTDCLKAFVCGGAICAFARFLGDLYNIAGFEKDDARLLVSVTLIFLSALFTGLGVFDKFAHFAGAGTLVPITGFANAVVSEAIDSKSEGAVLGLGAKIFTVAGPVILYGTVFSVLYGIVLVLAGLWAGR